MIAPHGRRTAALARTATACAVLALGGGAAWAQKGGGSAVLPGANGKQPINIEAVKLDYFDKEQKLVYTGGVVATQGDARLKASVLTIFLAPKGQAGANAGAGGGGSTGGSTSQVQRMLAAGPVTLLQRDQTGTGDSGVYDKAANTVVLTGNVTLAQGPNVTKGDKLTYDLKSGQAVVTGRVKSMFQPEDREATAAASPAAGGEPAAESPVRHTGRKGAGGAAVSR